MNPGQIRAAGAGLFFVFIFLSGFWLSGSGKPLNPILFTVHKLITLAAVVFLVINIYQANQAASLSPLERAACLLTGLLFIATIATGGLLSIDQPIPPFVHRLHQVIPFLTLLSSAATLYLLYAVSRGIAEG